MGHFDSFWTPPNSKVCQCSRLDRTMASGPMHDPFLNIAYARAQQAQQRQLKRRRAAARRAARTSTPDGDFDHEPSVSPTQRVGAAHEDRALQRLIDAGLVPLARN